MDVLKIEYDNLIFNKNLRFKNSDTRVVYDSGIGRDIGAIKMFKDSDQNNEECFSLSINIDYDLQGRGYGKKVMISYLDYIFKNTNIDKITNYVAGGSGNIGSIKLHESIGFAKEESSNKNFFYYTITKEQFLENEKQKNNPNSKRIDIEYIDKDHNQNHISF